MMQVCMEDKMSFAVIGKLGAGYAADHDNWIPALWQEANQHFAEIQPLVKTDESGNPLRIWGAMSDRSGRFQRWTDQGLYLAGCEVHDDAAAPEGWTKWVIPAYRYAIIRCNTDTYQTTFHDMIHDYLPNHQLTLVGAVHECYKPGDTSGELYLYFPVGKLG